MSSGALFNLEMKQEQRENPIVFLLDFLMFIQFIPKMGTKTLNGVHVPV